MSDDRVRLSEPVIATHSDYAGSGSGFVRPPRGAFLKPPALREVGYTRGESRVYSSGILTNAQMLLSLPSDGDDAGEIVWARTESAEAIDDQTKPWPTVPNLDLPPAAHDGANGTKNASRGVYGDGR